MGQVSAKLRSTEGGFSYWCQGCEETHAVRVGVNGWTFDGDLERPTFAPSVKVTSGHFAPGHTGDCWCTFEARFGRPSPFRCSVCHTHIRGGMVQFLGDCTHALAGQTLPLPDLPPDLQDAAA